MTCISEQVSVERIMAAANEIERMLKTLDYRSGLPYKHCDGFKKIIGTSNFCPNCGGKL